MDSKASANMLKSGSSLGNEQNFALVRHKDQRNRNLFLELLPREIRDEVYTCVLTNPILSHPDVFDRISDVYAPGFNDKSFGLSVQILWTCRQIYREAVDILYGSNEFIFTFTDSTFDLNPLLRNHRGSIHTIFVNPNFKKVKSWKLVLSTQEFVCCTRTEQFAKFCRLISDGGNAKKLTCVLRDDRILKETNHLDTKVALDFLKHLRLLRNLTSVEIEIAPHRWYDHDGESTKLLNSSLMLLDLHKLKPLLLSNDPVLRLYRMYSKLLTYAQAFERDEELKSHMESTWEEARYHCSWGYLSYNSAYPWKSELVLMVEDGLRACNFACQETNLESFLSERSAVLQILERQYQQIVEASQSLNCLIQDQLAKDFNACRKERSKTTSATKSYHSTVIYLAQQYARAFIRDTLIESEPHICHSPKRILGDQSSIKAEDLLCLLPYKGDGSLVIEYFKSALNTMDNQYLEIRKARKALFDCDDQEYPKHIDVEQWRSDQMIDWDVAAKRWKEMFKCPQTKPKRPFLSALWKRIWCVLH
ncbi:uncharacterized protein LY89DRAFT_787705 [Mollisia scopiformis]|uniref:DUF7730 domain-containing protein n=1 Tax=Mollisia scopiformis TaxID=149040 RepID=A0A132BC96_MOLSC|nr:uncharacterized protein LY89DRAFT_787705 [Mollisia scopiformis]KUJ10050.1 hypothetical protein LY89DRAFT_787705 [Mollisia scopiformis]